MDKIDESRRYKWSTSATNLLVSIWSHEMVQNQLKLSTRNQPIYESIARYMGRKGFSVTGLQCRTRIKNMLCSYYEAVRKKDPSFIEPYFELFKKVVHSKNIKKKGSRRISEKSAKLIKNSGQESVEEDGELGLSSDTSIDREIKAENHNIDTTYNIEYLDVNNQEVQVSSSLVDNEVMRHLERIITKAVDSQTQTISQTLQVQSEIIEKLLISEREKLEKILVAEKESRLQLESRLDRLLARFESTGVPQLTYMGTLIEPQQNEVL